MHRVGGALLLSTTTANDTMQTSWPGVMYLSTSSGRTWRPLPQQPEVQGMVIDRPGGYLEVPYRTIACPEDEQRLRAGGTARRACANATRYRLEEGGRGLTAVGWELVRFDDFLRSLPKQQEDADYHGEAEDHAARHVVADVQLDARNRLHLIFDGVDKAVVLLHVRVVLVGDRNVACALRARG